MRGPLRVMRRLQHWCCRVHLFTLSPHMFNCSALFWHLYKSEFCSSENAFRFRNTLSSYVSPYPGTPQCSVCVLFIMSCVFPLPDTGGMYVCCTLFFSGQAWCMLSQSQMAPLPDTEGMYVFLHFVLTRASVVYVVPIADGPST